MARSIDYNVHLDADNQITPEADKAAKSLDNLESKGDINVKVGADTSQATRDIDGLISKATKLGGEAGMILLDSNAAQITNEIADLIVEIDKADASDVTVDANVEQVHALQADLVTLQGTAKEISGTPVDVDTTPATGSVDKISESAKGAGASLENMVGNSAQDIAGLAGVSGSAGQAIGQLAETFFSAAQGADGLKGAMSGVGAAIGPLAALSAGVWLVSTAIQAYNAPAEAAAERTKQLSDAMDAGGDSSVAFADVLRGNADSLQNFIANANDPLGGFGTAVDEAASHIPLIGKYFKEAGVDVFDSMSKAGLSIYDMSKAMDEGGAAADSFNVQLAAAKEAGLITGEQYNAVSEALSKYSDSAMQAAKAAGLFNVSQDEANAILQDTVAQADPMAQMAGTWARLMADMADNGAINSSADAVNELAAALGKPPAEIIKMAQAGLDQQMKDDAKAAEEAAKAQAQMAAAVSDANIALRQGVDASGAFAKALGEVNAASELDFSQMAENTVSSFDDMKASLKDLNKVAVDWSTVDLSPDSVDELRGLPDELAKVTDGISGMRDSIQTELQAAFDTGGIQAYADKASFFAGEIQTQFPAAFKAAGASASEAQRLTNDLLTDLQLMPTDIAIMIRLTREEEARNALATFSSVISQMPDEVQVAINTKIAEGDIQGALDILNSQLINRGYAPIVLPVDAEISAAVAKANEAQAYADSLVGTEAVDADIAAAQAAADEAKAHADSLTATMPLNADGTPATATAAEVKAGVEGTSATMPLTADSTAATGEIAGVKSTADSTEGMVQIKADAEQAFATMLAINLITAAFAPPPVQITADGSSAVATAAATAASVSSFAPIMNVAANPAPALSTSAAAAAAIQSLKPIMSVFADPKWAISLGILAAGVIQSLKPVMTVVANPAPAISAGINAANVIASQRPNIPISAHLASYPSAASIANSIGVVRVPIDAYVRTMPRINGAVP